MFSVLPGDINFGKNLSPVIIRTFFLFLSFFSPTAVMPIIHMLYLLVIVPHFMDSLYSVLFFKKNFFFLCFSVWEVLIDTSSSSMILSSSMCSQLKSSSKAFLLSLIVFLISNIPF